LFSAVALLLCMVVQIPFAADPVWAQFMFFERGVFKFTMMTFFILVMVQSPRTLLWFLLAFLFACLYVTQESVQGLISGGLYWMNQGVMRLHGSVTMYQHPNSLAGLAMGVVPFVVFLFPVVKSKIIRLGLLTVLSTALICVVYSGSRTAYVAIIAFLLFWWAVSPRKIRFIMIGILVFIVANPVIPQQYKERFKSIGGQEAEGNSKGSRIVILKDAWAIFLSNPGGVGLASFPAVRAQRFGRRQDTHNLYLEVATNLGVQGLVAFFIFIYLLFRGNYRSYKYFRRWFDQFNPYLRHSGLSPPVRRAVHGFQYDMRLLMAVVKAVAGFVFVRLMLGFFGMDMYEIYWWFALGLTVALSNMAATVGVKGRLLGNLIENDQGSREES
jgi:O-antigen ligase